MKSLFFFLKNNSLEIAVFICGAAVMVFELIGSRLVAPYIGTSTYAWTGIIGIILASMSLGYYWGGEFADKNPKKSTVSFIVAVSAILIIISIFMKDIGAAFNRVAVPVELKSILISLFLFAPASFFLGIVSPYAVKLKVNGMETVGKNAGRLYAISTAGSIAGTFLAGFIIIPSMGSVASLFLTSFALVSASILLIGTEVKKHIQLMAVYLLCFASLFSYYFFYKNTDGFLLSDIDTEYSRVWIHKTKDAATGKDIIGLSTDPFGTQAAVFADKNDGNLVFDYTKFFRIGEFFNQDIKSALMIGGCVYTYPRDFIKNFPESAIDVVEIDPAMTDIAEKYFHYKQDQRISLIYKDGRIFLNENKKKYDAIFVDAFTSAASIPFHLTTKEAVRKEYDALGETGVALINIISAIEGENGKFLRAEYATYKEIFPQVFVFRVSQRPADKKQNIILVATKLNQKFNFNSSNQEIDKYLKNMWTKPMQTDVPVLTDDYAPVDYYIHEAT